MSTTATTVEPTAAALPPPPEDPFTPAQLGILSAIADAIVPPLISRSKSHKGNTRLLQHPLRNDVYDDAARRISDLARLDASNQDLATAYLGESATAQPEFKDSVQRLIGFYMPDHTRKQLLFILSALK